MHDDDVTVAERLRRQRSALSGFSLHAFKAQDIDDLLTQACRQVSEGLQVSFVKVLEHRPADNALFMRAGVNWNPGVVGHTSFGDGADSPGGYALISRKPVISNDVAAEERFGIPAVLREHGVSSMVNVIIAGDGDPYGVLEVDDQMRREFDRDDIEFLEIYANLLAAAIDRLRSQAILKDAARRQGVLAEELEHRIKNLFAVAQALAMQTAVADRTAKEFREAFLGRLKALSRAHGLMFTQGQAVTLEALIEQAVQPHRVGRDSAFVIEGEPCRLSGRPGLTIGLMLHELCTNAAKYGALSVAEGRVDISWRRDPDRPGWIDLRWREEGGPTVVPPEREGFGTRMLKRATTYELGGEAELEYAREGLSCRLRFPVETDDPCAEED